jgi:CRP-like cAMP-binding protein
MVNEFIEHLSKYVTLSDELIAIIVENIVIHHFEKGTILLREGDKVDTCYQVLKGCMRSYVIRDGEDKTIDFYTEEQPVVIPHFGEAIPSELYLECIEDTAAIVNNSDHEKEMYSKYPEFESVCRIVTEKMMEQNQVSFMDFKTASAEERYLQLIKERPNLIQRVPQYQLASFLGVKPESLSRIRRRIAQK